MILLTAAVAHRLAIPSRRSPGRRCAALGALAIGLAAVWGMAGAQPASRNLLVEVRLIDAADSAENAPATDGVTVGSRRGAGSGWQTQSLRLLNGTRGTMRFTTALPFLWVQSAGGDLASVRAASGSAGSNGGAGFTQSLTWLQAGQGLAIRPRWPGGRAEATVEIEVDVSRVEAPVGAEIPPSSHEATRTTISTRLGQWTTFAASGGDAGLNRSSWSTHPSTTAPRRLFQIKVQAL